MRERTIKRSANHIFWLTVYTLPLIFVIIQAIANSGNTTGYSVNPTGAFQAWGIIPDTNGGNLIADFIFNLFGNTEFGLKIIPAKTTPICYYLTWITEVTLIRLSLSLIMFLPKLGIKYLKKLGGEDCEIC